MKSTWSVQDFTNQREKDRSHLQSPPAVAWQESKWVARSPLPASFKAILMSSLCWALTYSLKHHLQLRVFFSLHLQPKTEEDFLSDEATRWGNQLLTGQRTRSFEKRDSLRNQRKTLNFVLKIQPSPSGIAQQFAIVLLPTRLFSTHWNTEIYVPPGNVLPLVWSGGSSSLVRILWREESRNNPSPPPWVSQKKTEAQEQMMIIILTLMQVGESQKCSFRCKWLDRRPRINFNAGVL